MIARFARIVLPLFFVASASAGGATDITITGAKMDPLPVFASPEDAMPLRTVPATGLPWAVKEAKSEFFRVSIDGVDVWVDSMKVRASRKVVARCGLVQPLGACRAFESSNRCM